jgi:hypothetical protein
VVHFSDPIPSPWDDGRGRAALIDAVAGVLERAKLVTFTTPEAAAYMRNSYGLQVKEKSTVVRNIVPNWSVQYDENPRHGRQIVYVGQFGGQRTPYSLVEGIALANARCSGRPVGLLLVGANARTSNSIEEACRGRFPWSVAPRTPDVVRYYADSLLAVTVDAKGECPFLATKTGEAVHAARRVLIITPSGSPAHDLFADRWRSVRATTHDVRGIADAIVELASLPDHEWEAELTSRRDSLAEFRDRTVARGFLNSLDQLREWRDRSH